MSPDWQRAGILMMKPILIHSIWQKDAKWQDGEPVTAEDVKFTIEAIMIRNGSENAPNYEDVEEINVIDDHTVMFKLEDKNVASLDYMTNGSSFLSICFEGDMQTTDFFRNPVEHTHTRSNPGMRDRRSHWLRMKIILRVSLPSIKLYSRSYR